MVRGDAKRAPEPAGRARGGRGVLVAPLETPRVRASFLPMAGSPSPSCARPVAHHHPIPAARVTWGRVGGVCLHLCFPYPAPNNWGLGAASISACSPTLPTSLETGVSPVLFLPAPMCPLSTFSHSPLSKTPGGELQAVGRPRILAQHPRPHGPPKPKGRSRLVGCGNSDTSVRGPAGATRGERDSQVCAAHSPDRGTMAGTGGRGEKGSGGRDGGGGDRQPSAATVRPQRERNCFSLRFSCFEAENASPGGLRAR